MLSENDNFRELTLMITFADVWIGLLKYFF